MVLHTTRFFSVLLVLPADLHGYNLFQCKFFNPPRANTVLHPARFFSVLLVLPADLHGYNLFQCKFFNPPNHYGICSPLIFFSLCTYYIVSIVPCQVFSLNSFKFFLLFSFLSFLVSDISISFTHYFVNMFAHKILHKIELAFLCRLYRWYGEMVYQGCG